jgi:hypothetical protein
MNNKHYEVEFLSEIALYWIPLIGARDFFVEIQKANIEELEAFADTIHVRRYNLPDFLTYAWKVMSVYCWFSFHFRKQVNLALIIARSKSASGIGIGYLDGINPTYPEITPGEAVSWLFHRELVSRGWSFSGMCDYAQD